MSEEAKQKILDFLKVKKGTGLDRKLVMKLIRELEQEGKIVGAGKSAGVGGYKLAG